MVITHPVPAAIVEIHKGQPEISVNGQLGALKI